MAELQTHPVARARKWREKPPDSDEPRKTVKGPSAIGSLDRLIHERLRLGILSALSVNEALNFNELKDILEVTDGNLSDHARKLEVAGYIVVRKGYNGRKPQTVYALTKKGKQALRNYLETMQEVIEQASASLR